MKLEDLVPDLSLCKLWKEKGGRQDTVFAWKVAYDGSLCVVAPSYSAYNTAVQSFAAPTAGELMQFLNDPHHTIEVCNWPLWDWHCLYYRKTIDGNELTNETHDAKLPNALLKMALEVEDK